MRRAAAALLAFAFAALPAGAGAQTPPKTAAALPVRAAQVDVEKGLVKITLSFRDVVDTEIARKLENGLPTVVTMRGYLFKESGGSPIALTARSCRIVKDIWEDVFRIQLVQPGGVSQTGAANIEGVLRICFDAKKLPLADWALLKTGVRYFVATFIEVNPVSQEILDQIKLWVTRPSGTSSIGPGAWVLGSFVGLFVARIPDADRKLAFRSAAFPAPPATP